MVRSNCFGALLSIILKYYVPKRLPNILPVIQHTGNPPEITHILVKNGGQEMIQLSGNSEKVSLSCPEHLESLKRDQQGRFYDHKGK